MGRGWDSRWYRCAGEDRSPALRYPVGEFDQYPQFADLGQYEWVLWKPGADPAGLLRDFRRGRWGRVLRHGLGRGGRVALAVAAAFALFGLYLLVERPGWTASALNSEVLGGCALLVAAAALLVWRGRVPRYGLGAELEAWNEHVGPWGVHSRQAGTTAAEMVYTLRRIADGTHDRPDLRPFLSDAHERAWNCLVHPSDGSADGTARQLAVILGQVEQRPPPAPADPFDA